MKRQVIFKEPEASTVLISHCGEDKYYGLAAHDNKYTLVEVERKKYVFLDFDERIRPAKHEGKPFKEALRIWANRDIFQFDTPEELREWLAEVDN